MKFKKNLPQIKPKPWGHEVWFTQNQNYAGKILFVRKGRRLSLQYHEKKQETQYLYSGKIKVYLGKNKNILKARILSPGDTLEILPYTIHRVEALEDSEIFEISTPELEDVVRLDDDYGRIGKGNTETLDRKLAKSIKASKMIQKI